MTLPAVCLDVLSFTGIIVAPQSDERGLRWSGIVWLHIPQYKKLVCVRCLWLKLNVFWDVIKHLSNLVNHVEYYFTWWGLGNGHHEIFMYFTPRDGHFRNISIFWINVGKNAVENVRINMWHLQVVNMS